MKQLKVWMACVLSSMATVALGATHNWTGEGGDHLFSTPENWGDGLSSDTWAASDNAVLFFSSAETVISNGVEGDFASMIRSVVGARADEAVIKVDANGVYAHVPRGAVILVR